MKPIRIKAKNIEDAFKQVKWGYRYIIEIK